MGVRPLRNLVLVERVEKDESPGGIVLPKTFEARHSPRLKMLAKPDYFEAEVIACGPDVRELKPGDHTLVFTFADGDGSTLYTGQSDNGRRADGAKRLFVKYPDDFVCAVDLEGAAE